jgi:hypothetical protein
MLSIGISSSHIFMKAHVAQFPSPKLVVTTALREQDANGIYISVLGEMTCPPPSLLATFSS